MATSLTGAAGAGSADRADAPEVEIIELEHERYRRMTVPVTIGGEGPFRFMIDTGAQATVLSRDLADRLAAATTASTATLVGMASRRPVETDADRRRHARQPQLLHPPARRWSKARTSAGPTASSGSTACRTSACCSTSSSSEISVADAEELGGNRGYEIVVRARERLGQLIITEARLDGDPGRR